MTPDGITSADWDLVKERAAKIATAVCAEKNVRARKETKALLVLLDQLEKKYGELPSILATRADYTNDASERLRLLKKAYALSGKTNDKKNMTYIASSLAEFYIVDRCNKKSGTFWLAKLRTCLKRHFDKQEFNVYKTLQKIISVLLKNRVRS